jgi:hypothetical protein
MAERRSGGANYDGGGPSGTAGGIEADEAPYAGITPLLTSIGGSQDGYARADGDQTSQ